MGIINRDNAEHYTWGSNCDAWHLLRTRRLSIVEERVPPGGIETPHYHRYATQLFYLLEGAVRFRHATDTLELKPGDAVHVLPGVVHSLENTGEGDAILLVVSNPESHSDRFEARDRDSSERAENK